MEFYEHEMVAEKQEVARKVIEKIDAMEKTSAEALLKVAGYALSEEVAALSDFSKDIFNYRVFAALAKKQLEAGKENVLIRRFKVAELTRIYQRMVFLLRRFEFDFPAEERLKLFSFMDEYNLGFDEIIAVLYGTRYLYDKELILKNVESLTENIGK